MAPKRKMGLRGSTSATVDEQGRLKIPTKFKDVLVKSYGVDFFITSLTGENVFVYPLSVWEAHEERLAKTARLNPHLRKYLDRVNYFGQEATMDKQGRILMPATLRDSATIQGQARVIGNVDHLIVWNEERIGKQIMEAPLTDDDLLQLANLGI